MNTLFDIDPSEMILKIRLAWAYTPRILDNHINSRPCSSFLYVLNGTYAYSYSSGGFIANAGNLVYLPAGSIPYSYKISNETDSLVQCLQIVFDLLDVKSNSPLSFSPHPMIVPLTGTDTVKYAIKATIAAFAKSDSASQLIAHSELLRVFAMCNRNGRKVTNANNNVAKTIAPAIEYLEENYNKNISAKELAQLCQVSESQLRRCFQSAIGKSPMEYRRELIYNAACNLLQLREFKVGEIAEILGFNDIYAFSHFFSNKEGISPLEYCRYAEEKHNL